MLARNQKWHTLSTQQEIHKIMLDQQFTPNWQVFFTKITHYLSNINIGFSPDKIRMSSNPDKSGNHSPPQPTPAQERIEETLRTLQEPLRRLLEN